MAKVIQMKNLGSEFTKLLKDTSMHNKRIIAMEVQRLPMTFLEAAFRFYPQSPLRVRTGRLRGSFTTISKQAGAGKWTVGLKSDVEYARIQHEGGQINNGKPIVPVNKKALFWKGARHPVARVNNPGFIKPKKFFSIPIRMEGVKSLQRLKKVLGFPRG